MQIGEGQGFLYQGGKGEGSAKNVLQKGEGQENLNMASLHLHQPPPPLNNDRSLTSKCTATII